MYTTVDIVIMIGIALAFVFVLLVGIAIGYKACRQIQKEERLAYSGDA